MRIMKYDIQPRNNVTEYRHQTKTHSLFKSKYICYQNQEMMDLHECTFTQVSWSPLNEMNADKHLKFPKCHSIVLYMLH